MCYYLIPGPSNVYKFLRKKIGKSTLYGYVLFKFGEKYVLYPLYRSVLLIIDCEASARARRAYL